MDFSMEKLSCAMLASGAQYSHFTREKLLIGRDGKILFKTADSPCHYQWHQENPQLLEQMMTRQNGTLTVKHDNDEHLLAFSLIKPLQLLYVEHIDLQALSEYMAQQSQAQKK